MNQSNLFLKAQALPLLFAFGVLSVFQHAAAQQFGGVTTPVANTAAPADAVGTPAGADVENPPPAGKPDPNAPTETEILATNGADFSSVEHIAVFQGDVRVNDPRFQLACQVLTVFLTKAPAADSTGKATPTPAKTPAPAKGGAPANADSNPGGGIDHAIAKGRVIIIQKRAATKPGEEPKVSVGRADEAFFDNKTGDMVLHGWPSVEQNGDTLVSLAQSTVITLHKDNSMNTVGPSRTIIKQKPGQGLDLPGSTPAASPKPATGTGGKKRPRGASPTPG